jgi:hypothetical protein
MKHLKTLIIVLTVLLLGMGAFYTCVLFNSSQLAKKQNTGTSPTSQSGQKLNNKPIVTDIKDYTRADSAISNGQTIKIQGQFQIIDPVNKVINNISYAYVLGILSDNNRLSKVWLTLDDYKQISQVIASGLTSGTPVLLSLTKTGISLEKTSP